MRTTAQKLTECYTFADYLGWGDSVRGELIDGVFYDITPSQSFSHQSLVCGILSIVRRGAASKSVGA